MWHKPCRTFHPWCLCIKTRCLSAALYWPPALSWYPGCTISTHVQVPWLPLVCCQLNTLRPGQNGLHFADDIFKRIFLNENVRISLTISLRFISKGPINNIPALVQIMAWCRPGDKPLSEPIMVRLPMHICVTMPQWVNHWPVKSLLY